MPLGRIADFRGVPSMNPRDFYGPPKGAILPLGGSSGYKGTALAMMVEILSGTLAGDLITDEIPDGNGLCFIAMNISNFIKPEIFRQNASAMVEYIKSCPPAEGSRGVQLTGEMELITKHKRLIEGIELDDVTYEQITKVTRRLKTDKNINT